MCRYNIILNYWFNNLNDELLIDEKSEVVKKWFIKTEKTDSEIKNTFEVDLINAKSGKYKEWESDIKGRLALIILYDQFSRNIYRNTSRMFDSDTLAIELSNRCIQDKMDDRLSLIEKCFLYMPFMHSEDINIQERSTFLFSDILDQAKSKSPQNIAYFENTLKFAKQHYEIIKTFNRFPHRNLILKRPSTQKELEFLKTPGSSF